MRKILVACLAVVCASSSAVAESPAPVLSAQFQSCLSLAQAFPQDLASRQTSGPDGPIVELSSRDSATVGCFLKFANLEKFEFDQCFAIARNLPGSFAQHTATEICFATWPKKASGVTANADDCDRVMKRASGVVLAAKVELKSDVSRFAPQGLDPAFKMLGILLPKRQRLEQCRSYRERLETAAKAAREAELVQGIQNSDRVDATLPDRGFLHHGAERPLSQAEKKICALEASLLATNFAALRQDRAETVAPVIADLRALLSGIPEAVRGWISIGRPTQAAPLLARYLKTAAPPSKYVKLDPATLKLKYELKTEQGVMGGQISIREKKTDEEAEIASKLLEPWPGGWDEYFKAQATVGCPSVKEPRELRPEALADTQVKLGSAAAGSASEQSSKTVGAGVPR